MTDIAIVGMACVYAGAATPRELWENALAGRRAFRRIPPERLRLEDYYDAEGVDPDRIALTQAAVLEGYAFDRIAYGVSGPTYRATDLTHWLALDMAARALADAGLGDGGPVAEETAVYVGNTLTGEFTRAHVLRTRWPYVHRVASGLIGDQETLAEFGRRFRAPFPEPDGDSLAGGLSNTIAGRICGHFGFGGGGYTLDGACAASLLAVIHGCQALESRDAQLVVAGGVDLSLDPFELVGFARAGALATTEMRVFDRRAQGFWPGEGCGMLVLTRLENAVTWGLRPYAVLRGWGVSSDGTGGITRPEVAGQRRALERAYRRAGFGADTVALFEAHGTGTPIGDLTELTALSQVVGTGGSAAISSVKAAIGHTKAAAGAAGLIKAVMAVHSQTLPPAIACEEPHELLTGDRPLRVLAEPEPWPADRPLRAAVSAMGFGGINTHVVLEGLASHRRRGLDGRTRSLGRTSQDRELLVFAAPTAKDLRERLSAAARVAPLLSRAQVADLAAHLAGTCGEGAHRAAVVAATPEDLGAGLAEALAALDRGERLLGPRAFTSGPGPRGIGLLCSGQASRAPASGGALARRFPSVAELYAEAGLVGEAADTDTRTAQPRITTASIAALLALGDLGVVADVALGHSLGELTALHWAGALGREDLLALVRARGEAMAAIPGEHGAMASVAGGPEDVADRLPPGTVIACLNGPSATVISGSREGVDRAVRELGATRLPVSHAFHSPLIEPAAAEFARHLDKVGFARPAGLVLSTVTGGPVDPATDLRAHLTRQITAPVRFTDAIGAADGIACWVEAGPDSVLTGLAAAMGRTSFAVGAAGRTLAGLLQAAAAAWVLGQDLKLQALFAGRLIRPIDLSYAPSFLANPCERAPEASVPRAEPVRVEPVPAQADGDDPAEVVRRLVAERVELPLEAVTPASRLSADLHLNSITVAQLIAEAARRLGLPVPVHLTEFAGASIAEVAEALAAGEAEQDAADPVAGVDSWVRVFTVEHVEEPLNSPGAVTPAGHARVLAPPGHPLATALADLPEALVLCLPEAAEPPFDLFAQAAAALPGAPRLVVVQHAEAGAGFARSAHLETGIPTTVITVPDTPDAAAWIRAELASATSGYVEARYDAQGRRTVPVLRLQPLPQGRPGHLGPQDVLLVSGGGRGIGLECARHLARRTGARLALLGRSDPAEDPGLRSGLDRLDGIEHRYYRADVTDADAVAEACRRAEAELGPVTGILHCAADNEPTPLAQLDAALLERTFAPKVRGARNLLAAVDRDRLRLFVAFSSLIARTGLAGEAHYALANDWLGALVADMSGDDCRSLAIEWSVWAGAGMGERLGVLDALARRGIDPIPVDTGLDVLTRLVSAPVGANQVVVTGRYGEAPTVRREPAELPMTRFLEHPRRFVPGVELVADVNVSTATDLYLDDHVFGGDRLLPAVLGLEAMAQAAAAVAGLDQPPVFTDVRFAQPIAVPAAEEVTVRVAALVDEDGAIRVALRSSATGFVVDHFTATCVAKNGAGSERLMPPLTLTGEPISLDPGEQLYGGLLFQSGRFRRVRGYLMLTGYACAAELAADAGARWFAGHLPRGLALGDPGRRDAAVHAIQACLPRARLLPVGVERITIMATESADAVLHARERHSDGTTYVFDFEVADASGRVLERWEGLRLRVLEAGPALIPPALIAPHLQRYCRERLADTGLELTVESGGGRVQRRARAAARLFGPDTVIRGRGDGRPEVSGGRRISVSHEEDLTIAATATVPVGVDLVRLGPAAQFEPLGPEDEELRALLGDDGAARVWAAREAVRKCAGRPGAPLTFAGTDGAMVLFRSGRISVVTHLSGGLVTAVALEAEDRDA
ncbi:type I polyketide synthase [Nonomuraea sp. SYSU D8015]|uniref:type I polyketide synthase n=1 Tax=Nonomuraea sp. SYSU D8015 TaxID=2593644 RepID=UPI001660224D|nr:type I polyketide synthase [Nonomuraea sp. SYSU D8015]